MQVEQKEEHLILAAQQGDRQAFAQLYELNVDRVYYYLLKRLGQPADAEDLTAEVFIRAMEALSSYKNQGVPFIAWLVRIAHNTSVNHFKKQNRRKETPLVEAAAISDDPADKAVTRATSAEVSGAMKKLTDLQRQVLNLRFLGEFSIAETADKMSRTESAVKFLQHSALKALKRVLRDQEANSHAK